MRIRVACGLVIVCATTLVAQTGGQPPKTSKAETTKTANKPITLSGCVQRGESAPNQFTLVDGEGVKYRLIGTDVRDYLGRRVQIVGGLAPRRLKIAGGLQPSPNVAAQAGAIDPTRAATAAAGGSAGPGAVELPEFRVKSVRPVSGSCPD